MVKLHKNDKKYGADKLIKVLINVEILYLRNLKNTKKINNCNFLITFALFIFQFP
jgi:hypothetical protein